MEQKRQSRDPGNIGCMTQNKHVQNKNTTQKTIKISNTDTQQKPWKNTGARERYVVYCIIVIKQLQMYIIFLATEKKHFYQILQNRE